MMLKKQIALFLLLALLLSLCPPLSARAEGAPCVVISELMASNRAAVPIEGEFPDWVELYNAGDEAVTLEKLWLCCGKKAVPLSGGSLAPGAYRLIPCRQFRLPKEGAELRLADRSGEVLDSVAYVDAPADQSLVRTDAGLVPCRWPSPGEENSPAGYARWQDRLTGGELLLWEVSVYNDFYPRADGSFLDWIELKNGSDRALSLADYRLADKRSEIGRWPLPDVTLQPGELYILFCGDAEGGVPFTLSAGSDELYLTHADGSLCDSLSLHDVPLGGTVGRMKGEGGFFYFTDPSPGWENRGGLRRVAERPEAAEPCGVFEPVEQVLVKLSAPGEIHYTLDGSLPTRSSPVYDGPLTLTQTCVVRAVAYEGDALPSRSLDLSYILNEGHDLPVVSVIADPASLFSDDRGIYANPEKNWEVPASAALFASERGFETVACGLKMHGAKSRINQAKKSFKLCFRGRYGGELDCDLFENGVTAYSDVLLRSAWESSVSTQMRDVLMHVLGKEFSASLPTQDYRYCALYLNGEYWGLYALREAHSEEHYARHFGFSPESVTMSQGDWPEDPEGEALWNDVVSHDLRDADAFEWVSRRLDLESVIAWSIVQSYSGNIDMNSPNMRFYRSTEDGLLRYALVDLDLGFFGFGAANLSFRTGNPYSEVLLRLMENEDFRALYLRRLSEALHGPFSDESFLDLVRQLSDEMRGEIPRDYLRWGEDPDEWQHEINAYLFGSTSYSGGHAVALARSAREVFHLSDREWETLFADLA